MHTLLDQVDVNKDDIGWAITAALVLDQECAELYMFVIKVVDEVAVLINHGVRSIDVIVHAGLLAGKLLHHVDMRLNDVGFLGLSVVNRDHHIDERGRASHLVTMFFVKGGDLLRGIFNALWCLGVMSDNSTLIGSQDDSHASFKTVASDAVNLLLREIEESGLPCADGLATLQLFLEVRKRRRQGSGSEVLWLETGETSKV